MNLRKKPPEEADDQKRFVKSDGKESKDGDRKDKAESEEAYGDDF